MIRGGSLNLVPNLQMGEAIVPNADDFIDTRNVRSYNSGILRVDNSGHSYIFATRLYARRRNGSNIDRPFYYHEHCDNVFNAIHLTILRINSKNVISLQPDRAEAVFVLGTPGDYSGEDPRLVWVDREEKLFMVVVPTRYFDHTDKYMFRPYGALFQYDESNNRFVFREFRRLELAFSQEIQHYEKNWVPFRMGDHSIFIPNLGADAVWKRRSGEAFHQYREHVTFHGGATLCGLIDAIRGGTPGIDFKLREGGTRGSLMVVHATLQKKNHERNPFVWCDDYSAIPLIDGTPTREGDIQSAWDKKYVMAFVYLEGFTIKCCTAFFMPSTRRGEHSRVIFPCGLARAPSGDVIVTFGENDEVSGYEFFKKDDIRAKLKPLEYWQEEEHRGEILCNHLFGDWNSHPANGVFRGEEDGLRFYGRGASVLDITSCTYSARREQGRCTRTVQVQRVELPT